jgi:hypothetical protein
MQQFEANAVNKRYTRELARVERDRTMEEAIIRAQFQKNSSIERRNEEERLAMELERIKHDKLRDEKTRQQIRYKSIIEFFNLVLSFF